MFQERKGRHQDLQAEACLASLGSDAGKRKMETVSEVTGDGIMEHPEPLQGLLSLLIDGKPQEDLSKACYSLT